jgi:4-amino-4-deoxy-L-arabinose transferase-like glycosyltransferase
MYIGICGKSRTAHLSTPALLSNPNKYIFLAALLFLHVACWLVLGPPEPRSDDRVYLDVAADIDHGVYALNESPKNRRYAVILPALAFTKLFGDGPHAVSLWPLLCSLASIGMLFSWLWPKGKKTAVAAGFLLAMNPVQVIYATVLFPDAVVSLFVLLAAYFIFRGRERGKPAHGLAAAASILAGFFAKETVLLLLPFAVALSVRDGIMRRHMDFWTRFYTAVAVGFLLVWGAFYYASGDALFLLRSIESRHNAVFVPPLAAGPLLERLTWRPLVWLLSQPGYALLVLPAMVWLFKRQRGAARWWKTYLIMLAAAFWWGSSSAVTMAPMLLYDRMWMPLLAPLCVAAASFFAGAAAGRLSAIATLFAAALFALAGAGWLALYPGKLGWVFMAYALLFVAAWKSFLPIKNPALRLAMFLMPYAAVAGWFVWSN